MTLEGFTRPFSPNGRASLAPSPPYDAAMTGLVVHFRADETALNALLPAPFEPHETMTGQAFWAYIDHIMTPSDDEVVHWHPDRTRMNEVLLGVPCTLFGKSGVFYCFAWTDRDWSLMTEWLFGWCGKLARLSMTHMQAEHPRFRGPAPGSRYHATIERFGARVATASVVLERQADASVLPMRELLHAYGIRHIPNVDIRAGGRPLVHDIVHEAQENMVLGDVWQGSAELSFGDVENEDLAAIQPTETIAGYLTHFGYRANGVEVVYDYLAQT
jgi:acetoacetate decarboxylase